MEFHVLDLIVFILLGALIWFLLGKISDGKYTTPEGDLLQGIGCMVIFVYTALYWFFFMALDYNIIDIINNLHAKIKW